MSNYDLSALCRLIEVSLHHHKEVLELVELSKENERKLLISLSQVFRQIQAWTSAVDSIPLIDEQTKCCASVCENRQCLTDIVVTLISFLTVENKYCQHSVGNILVAVSKLIAADQPNWKKFVDLLVICLELAISNALLHEHLEYDSPGLAVLQLRLKNSNWSTVAEILRILRVIVKALKEEIEHDVGSLEIFMCLLSSCLARLPWDTLDALHRRRNIIDHVKSSESMNAKVTQPRVVFIGSLVQLLSSLVEAAYEIEGLATSQNKQFLSQGIKTIVPRISEWCLAKDLIRHDKNILPYFQHKILMLMSRFDSRVLINCSTILLWLQLLHEFYGDFLTKSISPIDRDQDNCLEGSPFLWSLSNQGNNHLSTFHLQRKSIFLFFRLSMYLIVWEESNGVLCTCSTVDSDSTSDPIAVDKCNARRKCIVEFCEWIQSRFPVSMIRGSEICIKKCIGFSSSFIKLYMHEDDLLFEVLLQMFNVATYADKHRPFRDEGASLEADEDALFHIAELFDPILLFHAFLAELQYDHQLLLDYLISKDSGIRCAEYLLKCLRKVCDSWKKFVELPLGPKNNGTRKLKKRKFSLESLEMRTPTTSQSELAMLHKEYTDDDPQIKRSAANNMYFIKAKTCLLSLKSALVKLHKKSLFPYNPEVLIRRLKKFEELSRSTV